MLEFLVAIQGYAYWFFTIVLVVILYSYIYHLYRSEKTGERDYEKYGNIAINDDFGSPPIEAFPKKDN